ncbi:MAG: LacI family transcriptional regulator [Chloroflexi bacterium]|nr:MAG: LacI family transcriptional regulator [Chloroflexota bacterium]
MNPTISSGDAILHRPTIADVARLAGVSKSTVSRVLSGRAEYMRDETRARVEQAIAELGYRPSSVARSLVSKRTLTAAMLVSDIGNPFYPEVIAGAEDVALGQGYNIFLCSTNYDLERGLTFVRSLIDKQVDGVLVMSSSVSDEWLQELAQHRIPVVVLDWEPQNVHGPVGVIGVDFAPGIHAAVAHLVGLGHRQLAHVSGPRHLRTSHLRQNAFLEAAAAHGLDPGDIPVVEGDLQVAGGRKALAHLLNLPRVPTAVFAANDLMAMGIVRAARARGLRVPHDLSVIGLDNIWLAADMDPPLSTVALPRYEIGQLAMRMLFELLQQPDLARPFYRRQVATHFLARESTAPPKS